MFNWRTDGALFSCCCCGAIRQAAAFSTQHKEVGCLAKWCFLTSVEDGFYTSGHRSSLLSLSTILQLQRHSWALLSMPEQHCSSPALRTLTPIPGKLWKHEVKWVTHSLCVKLASILRREVATNRQGMWACYRYRKTSCGRACNAHL